jgi:hypothetical protein
MAKGAAAAFGPKRLSHTRPPNPLQSLLAFKPISYTPWPVPADAPGERVRIEVGRVGSTEPRCAADRAR